MVLAVSTALSHTRFSFGKNAVYVNDLNLWHKYIGLLKFTLDTKALVAVLTNLVTAINLPVCLNDPCHV